MNTITTRDGTSLYYEDWGTGNPSMSSHRLCVTSADEVNTDLLAVIEGVSFDSARTSPCRMRRSHLDTPSEERSANGCRDLASRLMETSLTCHSHDVFPRIQIRILAHLFLMAENDGGVWCQRTTAFWDYLAAQHGEDVLIEVLVSYAEADVSTRDLDEELRGLGITLASPADPGSFGWRRAV
jgi:hypothetical protein